MLSTGMNPCERAELAKRYAERTRSAWRDEIGELHRKALELLGALDRLGLLQAAAYVSMALDAMRRRHPHLSAPE